MKITFDEYDAEEVAELEKKNNEVLNEELEEIPYNDYGNYSEDEMLEEFFRYYFNR